MLPKKWGSPAPLDLKVTTSLNSSAAAAAAPSFAAIHPLVPVASYVHRVFHNTLILLKKIPETPRAQKKMALPLLNVLLKTHFRILF